MVPRGNSAVIAAITQPSQNWGQRMAARQEALQLQSYLTQNAELQLAQEQQAAAQAETYLQSIKSLPFVGSDVGKLSAYVKQNIEKPIYERLRDQYGGSFKRWFAAEGSGFFQQAASQLQQSPLFQRATQNRLGVQQAQEAIKKGEVLVGGNLEGTDKYMPGEAMLSDFLSGKRDNFDFIGSYKPEDDLKPLRETYAPGKMPWEVVPVSEQEKLNFLIDAHGQQKGMDKYLRQHQGTRVNYKYDSLDKMQEFGWKAQDQKMQRERHGKSMTLMDQQMGLNALRAQKLKNDISENPDIDNAWKRLTSSAINEFNIPINGDKNNVLSLYGQPTYGNGEQLLAGKLGLQKINDKDGGYSLNGLRQVLTDKGDTIDLSGIQGRVIGITPKLYYNAKEAGPNGTFDNGMTGYARVTVQFKDPYEAEKLNLYDPNWGWLPDWQTKKGTGIYDPDSQTATFTVPYAIDKAFVNQFVKNNNGQKMASDELMNNDVFVVPPTF